MGKTKHTSLACHSGCSILQSKVTCEQSISLSLLIELTQTPRIEPKEKEKKPNHGKPSLVSNTNLRYYLISEQILVQQLQASWYTENRAITLLEHLMPQHGTIHGDFVKI